MNIQGQEIPPEVINAAIYIDTWFKTQGIEKWRLLNICSSNYANKLAQTESRIIDILNLIDK